MAEHVEINGQHYEVVGTHEDGLPILRGRAHTIEHKDDDGNQIFDEDGHPKVSVVVNVTPVLKMDTPGEAE